MGIHRNTGEHLKDEHPELMTCMSTGQPAEVYWVGPNIALTADEALIVLPRLLADAVALKMRCADNAQVETHLLSEVLSQLRTSLHSERRQWGDVSELVLKSPAGVVDLLAIAHEGPLRESAQVAAAQVDTNLSIVQENYERQTANNVPLRYWPRQFDRSARHLLSLLRRANVLESAFEQVRGEPWPEPLDLATLPATIEQTYQLVKPFERESYEPTPEHHQAAPDVLRLALRLLSRAQEAAARQERLQAEMERFRWAREANGY